MPIPLAAGLIVGAAGTALSAINSSKNRKRQAEQNEQDRAHERDIMNQQRQWSLEDWDRQNVYNSPEQQMNRLRQAGLNPNLVYGKGADNTAMAINQTKSTPSSKPAPFMAPIDTAPLQNSLMQHAQIQQIQAQTDNLHEQNNLLQKDMLVKDMEIAGKGINNARNEFDLNLAQELKDNTIEAAKVDLANKKQDMYLALNEDERRNLNTSSNIQKTMQDIMESKIRALKIQSDTEMNEHTKAKIWTEIDNLQQIMKNNKIVEKKFSNEVIMQEYEKRLNIAGLERSSPAALKIFVNMLNDLKRLGYEYTKEYLTKPKIQPMPKKQR